MKALKDVIFRRRFSVNPNKILRLPLLTMDCYKDWLHTDCGQPYPLLTKTHDDMEEYITHQQYCVSNTSDNPGEVVRLLGGHFPYATYSIGIHAQAGTAGIRICMPTGKDAPGAAISILGRISEQSAQIITQLESDGVMQQASLFAKDLPLGGQMLLIVTCRGANFDLYWQVDGNMHPLGTWSVAEMTSIVCYHRFIEATAELHVQLDPGEHIRCTADGYLDSGVSHADIKCMRYENGQPILADGRLYLTMSARAEQGAYQAVLSWNPSGSDFRLEGALFFDYGDDAWCADVASSVIFDRKTSQWYVWACAFSHGHVLCHATSLSDLRHGIHVLDAQLMHAQHCEQTTADELSRSAGSVLGYRCTLDDDTLFFAKSGDEDPDLVYDAAHQRWLLSICRSVSLPDGGHAYRYFLYESAQPFDGFRWIGNTTQGENTGGSFIHYDGQLRFLCGSDFGQVSRYHLFELDDLTQYDLLKFNYSDGGFRGWGTLIPVPCGNRTRYLHITFDRHGGSSWRWSYGNLYVFEADAMRRLPEWSTLNNL